MSANSRASASYHPSGYGVSPSLKRARAPFVTRNLMTGAGIVLFAGWVYYYSITAVKQDDFADIKDLLPPASERSSLKSIEDEERERKLQKLTFNAQSQSQSQSQPVASSSSLPSSISLTTPTTTTTSTSTSNQSPSQSQSSTTTAQTIPNLPTLSSITSNLTHTYSKTIGQVVRGRKAESWLINGGADVDRLGRVWEDEKGRGRLV